MYSALLVFICTCRLQRRHRCVQICVFTGIWLCIIKQQLPFFFFAQLWESIMTIHRKTWISTFLNLTMTIFLKARLKSWRHRQGRNGLKSVCVQDDPSWKVFVALHLLSKIVGEWREKKTYRELKPSFISHIHTPCLCIWHVSAEETFHACL